MKKKSYEDFEAEGIERAMRAMGCGALIDRIRKDTEDSMKDSAQDSRVLKSQRESPTKRGKE